MRFLATILSTCLLIGGSLAKAKSSTQRYEEFSLLSRTTTPVILNEATYKSLTTAPRDYSVAMLLTAHEARLGCQMCREFQPEFDLVSKSWLNGDKKQESRLLFGMLDFAEGRDIFISLGLQTVPVLLLFPPTEGPHAVESKEPVRYDFSTGAISAELVQAWLAKNLPNRPHPPVKRPINWLRVLSTITIVLGAGTVLVTASPYVLPIVQNRNIWATISLIAILLFTSGHMFNHIRNVPYVTGDGQGGISYFANGFQTQFGLETQIVAALYGFLSFCAISLATKVPRMTDAKSQQVAVLVWGVMLFLLYSFLLSIFRIKNGGYPFSLPPFM